MAVQEQGSECTSKLGSGVMGEEKKEFDNITVSPARAPITTHGESPTVQSGFNGTGDGSPHLVKEELEKTPNDVPMDAMFKLSNSSMSVEFRTDQVREDNFTDLDIICCDGYVQVHRCLLLGASKFLRDLLIDKDIMDTTAISLPDVSVHHMTRVLSLLYCGKTLIDKVDEVKIFSIMTLIGLPVDSLLCRTAKENDASEISFLRHLSNNSWITADDQYGTGKSTSQDDLHNNIEVDNLPEGHANSQINDSRSSSLTNTDDYSSTSEYALKCATCGLKHTSEEELLRHMQTSENCSDEISQLICLENKMCLVCEYVAPKRVSIRDLMDHVSLCMESSKRSEAQNEEGDSIAQNEEDNLASLAETEDMKDISFEEACNGLEEQMSLQSQHLQTKTMLRKRDKAQVSRNHIDDVDLKSISSNGSCTSFKSGKRRKLSGESTTDNCSIESNDQLIEPPDQHSSNTYTFSNINQDCIRMEINITKPRDIYELTPTNLRILFQQCPLCKCKYLTSKRAARCLRNHGYRICWVCLKVLPIHGTEFEDHNQTEHIQSPETKVTCPLCLKKFDCNIGLPTHIGNFHYPRVIEQTSKDTKSDILCSTSLSSKRFEEQETNNSAEEITSADNTVCDLSNDTLSETNQQTISDNCTSKSNKSEESLAGTSETSMTEDSACSSTCVPSQKPSESALIPTIPADIASSMEELAGMVRSCQICHKLHKFSENATKCIKSHGYKRCWACIKAFPTDELVKHVSAMHDIPGKPGIVKCFICSKDYAYDKGLNLHIGKHLAFYIRVRDMLPSSAKNTTDEANSKATNKSEDEAETKSVKSEETNEESPPKRKRCIRKSNGETIQKKSKTIPNGKCSTNQTTEDEGNAKDQNNLTQSDPDHLTRVTSPSPLGRNNPLAGRVFLETKDINGVKYNVYGFMDPEGGVQSGKTIAIQSNKDPSVQA